MFRFGGEFRAVPHGFLRFWPGEPELHLQPKWTNGPLDSSAAAPIGQGLASYLLGVPSSGSISLNDSYADQSRNYALYFQSDWRVPRTLTINAGVRYDYDEPVTERFNRSVSNFNFNARQSHFRRGSGKLRKEPDSGNPGLPIPGERRRPVCRPERPTTSALGSLPLDFRPAHRPGLAGHRAHRGPHGLRPLLCAAGSGQEHRQPNRFHGQPRLMNPSLDNGLTFIASLSNPYPSGLLQPLGAAGGLQTGLGQAVSFFPAYQKTGYLERWSFGVQRQLPKRVFLDVSYVASRGTRLVRVAPVRSRFPPPISRDRRSAIRPPSTT